MRKRVICIDDSKNQNPNYTGPSVEFMQAYHVIDEFDYYGVWTYILEEFGDKYGFSAKKFAPTTDQTADQMQEQEKESILM